MTVVVSMLVSFADIASAWQAIQTTVNADDVVIVFGSFYTVAGFKSL